jgi:Ca2+-binding EF-hand superfamily protein
MTNGSFDHTLHSVDDAPSSENDDESPRRRLSPCERWMQHYKEMTTVVRIMPYKRHKNQHWDDTFRSMGWSKSMVASFWNIFCQINVSRTGEFTYDEFLKYFGLERTRYTVKCFEYFDTTGGGDIDFLEFIISLWNVCPVAPETLPYLAFDLYDLDADGELSTPEIEFMVEELFGVEQTGGNTDAGVYTQNDFTGLAKACLDDFLHHSLQRAGKLTVDAFCNVVQRHSMFFFPIFQIQSAIRKKVMGDPYWQDAYQKRLRRESRDRRLAKKNPNHQKVFQPRHVQIVLRAYKAKSAAAFMSHTGDPNEGLRQWMDRERKGHSIAGVAEDTNESDNDEEVKESATAVTERTSDDSDKEK